MYADVARRLIKIVENAPNGCACISFYDFIRCYPAELLIDFPNINVPIEFLDSHTDWAWNWKSIIPSLSWVDIERYESFKKFILKNYPQFCSYIKDLPIKLIKSLSFINWDWSCISLYNTTFQETDLIELQDKLEYPILGNNVSIPLDWILNHPEFAWSWHLINERLNIRQIDWLYQSEHSDKLDFEQINEAYNVSVEEVLSRPAYPWCYEHKINPTIEYYIQYQSNSSYLSSYDKNLLLMRSEMISIDDISINYDLSMFKHNQNLTLELFCLFKENDKPIYTPLHQPKLQKYYRNIYSNIIRELNYINS